MRHNWPHRAPFRPGHWPWRTSQKLRHGPNLRDLTGGGVQRGCVSPSRNELTQDAQATNGAWVFQLQKTDLRREF
jgi:hypothetical protein